MTTIENFFIKLALALKSRTAWTIASLLVAQLPGIKSQLSPTLQGVVDVALAILGIYFRMNPSPDLNANIAAIDNHQA
jgi:hypothetical protein